MSPRKVTSYAKAAVKAREGALRRARGDFPKISPGHPRGLKQHKSWVANRLANVGRSPSGGFCKLVPGGMNALDGKVLPVLQDANERKWVKDENGSKKPRKENVRKLKVENDLT